MDTNIQVRRPWNKGLIVGQKRPLLPRQVWSIRVRLEMSGSPRDLALFNLAIDSKLRASDLVRLKTEDICSGALVRDRGVVTQLKTGRPVQFEITEVTRQSVERLLATRQLDDTAIYFEVAQAGARTSRRGSTPASSIGGSATSGSMTAASAPTRCEEPKSPSSIGRQAICAQSSCYSVTRRSKLQCATLEWK
jgi:hypothetical protein